MADYPYGNLGDVALVLEQEEVLLVMYYAPWCSKSKAARREYEKVAEYLADEVRMIYLWNDFKSYLCKVTQ